VDVSIVAWLRFFARHKRALVACLRQHCVSDEMATALAEVLYLHSQLHSVKIHLPFSRVDDDARVTQVLMSRELVKDWHLNPTDTQAERGLSEALGRLPPQFVLHLLIFPVMEDQVESALGICLPYALVPPRANKLTLSSSPWLAVSAY
jgi:hypothetical protein